MTNIKTVLVLKTAGECRGDSSSSSASTMNVLGWLGYLAPLHKPPIHVALETCPWALERHHAFVLFPTNKDLILTVQFPSNNENNTQFFEEPGGCSRSLGSPSREIPATPDTTIKPVLM